MALFLFHHDDSRNSILLAHHASSDILFRFVGILVLATRPTIDYLDDISVTTTTTTTCLLADQFVLASRRSGSGRGRGQGTGKTSTSSRRKGKMVETMGTIGTHRCYNYYCYYSFWWFDDLESFA